MIAIAMHGAKIFSMRVHVRKIWDVISKFEQELAEEFAEELDS